jgi:hypothetical protein
MLVQTGWAQKKGIRGEQLFITNKVTGKSIKIGANESTLKGFGELLRVDTLDMMVEPPDYYKRYVFSNIEVYSSTQGHITSFTARSNKIVVEKKGCLPFHRVYTLMILKIFFRMK